jgi:hypothetical protein
VKFEHRDPGPFSEYSPDPVTQMNTDPSGSESGTLVGRDGKSRSFILGTGTCYPRVSLFGCTGLFCLKLFFHLWALHRSGVLRTMLAADMREGNTGRIEMKVSKLPTDVKCTLYAVLYIQLRIHL